MTTNELFQQCLLGTSRVLWPAAPWVERDRIVIHIPDPRLGFDDRLALSQAYVALLAFQREHEHAARCRFLNAAQWLAERLRESATRRDLPRDREIKGALGSGYHRFRVALAYAERLIDPRFAEVLLDHVDEAAAALAAARNKKRAEPIRPRDYRRRRVEPFLPLAHLGMPIVAARLGVAELDLAPRGIPEDPLELLLNRDWSVAALAAAERWRRALGRPRLIEVRVRGVE